MARFLNLTAQIKSTKSPFPEIPQKSINLPLSKIGYAIFSVKIASPTRDFRDFINPATKEGTFAVNLPADSECAPLFFILSRNAVHESTERLRLNLPLVTPIRAHRFDEFGNFMQQQIPVRVRITQES
ncbi:MAG: hypothetical protein IJF67_07235, partial [Clostridia bacterium]|nr:hypothetical protein [Clostridia bacterium]